MPARAELELVIAHHQHERGLGPARDGHAIDHHRGGARVDGHVHLAHVGARALEQGHGLAPQALVERTHVGGERLLEIAHALAVVAQLELDHAQATQGACVGRDGVGPQELSACFDEVPCVVLEHGRVDGRAILGRFVGRERPRGLHEWRRLHVF